MGETSMEVLPETTKAFEVYNSTFDRSTAPQNIGLSQSEFTNVCDKQNTIKAAIEGSDVPLLVPTSELYWYNADLLQDEFGDRPVYFYSQVALEGDSVPILEEVLEQGGVIITSSDGSSSDKTLELEHAVKRKYGEKVEEKTLRGAFLNQYLGRVTFPDIEPGFRTTPGCYQVFQSAVESGELEDGSVNGVSLIETITGEDADRLWNIYKNPFRDISTNTPINAGFDEEGFYEALQDPDVVKVINRKDGEITTLALFQANFAGASWLNEEYFKQRYPDAFESGNLLLFLGIVSDENMRGNAYSADLMTTLLKVLQLRGSDVLVTFECNEVSSGYLPDIVDGVVNDSGFGEIEGLKSHISQIVFKSLSLN